MSESGILKMKNFLCRLPGHGMYYVRGREEVIE